MKLDSLPKTTSRSQKRRGRGYGSGKGGHTVGRGQKGQKSRGKVRLLFEGTKTRKSFLKRMPMLRGKKKLTSYQRKPLVIKVGELEQFPKDTVIDIEALVKGGLLDKIQARLRGVKILSDGKLTKRLTVNLPVSKAALKKIEKAGGKVRT